MGSTKERIVLTAEKLFARFGLEKTTVDEIAKIAHVAKGTIYHYFKSKEAVFEAVLNKEKEIVMSTIKRNIDAVHTPQEKIHVYVITRLKFVRELSNYFSALKEEYLSHYAFINTIREKWDEEEISLIKSVLDFGCQNNVFAIDDTATTANGMVTALKGVEYPMSTMETSFSDIEKNVKVLLNLFFKGLEVR